jgi:phosphate transport system substrate-binding protein
MKFTSICTLMLSAVLLLSSCNGGRKADKNASGGNDLQGTISIDGSSTVYPITEAVAEEFRNEAQDVKVTVGLSGTGGGFKKFVRGETDINNASRPITEKEIADAKANNISYVELKIAYDGLAIVVNPKNTWAETMTVAELKKIWEPAAQGKIKKWNQIRPEWPNEEIHLFGAGVESGTYDYFTEVIVGKAKSSRGDYTGSEDDNVLVQGIATDKNALGFFGLAYYEENKDKLKLIGIDDQDDANGKGAIKPSQETVINKTYAPLSRPLFIYVNNKATQRQEVIKFVDFYLNNAADLAKSAGYVPMPEAEYNAEKEKFSKYHSENK